MAQAYVPIQTVTVGSGGAASIAFNNIPQTYTDLIIKLSVRTGFAGVADDMRITLNGLGSNYSNRILYGNGSSAFSSTAYGNYGGVPAGANATANTFSNIEIYIPNYTSSNAKSWSVDSVSENNATEAYTHFVSGLNTTTSAITSISLAGTNNFAQFSTATLYGIGGARASGGTITADSRYTYHTFTSTGTFTALEKIKDAEVIVVGGGGGGGQTNFGGYGVGAGGGGGGVKRGVRQLLTAGNTYTVVVGAGGNGGTGGSGGTAGSSSLFSNLTATGGSALGQSYSGGTSGADSSNAGGSGGTTSAGSSETYAGGGGGGSGGVGGNWNGSTTAGNGGNGTSWVNGSFYGGGGGGGYGRRTTSAATGVAGTGTHGGGNGTNADNTTGGAGTANTGGGGGGAGTLNAGSPTSGAGGSGVVIIAYPN